MACQMDRVLLEEYADGLLPKLERLLVEEHIKACSSCKKQLTELKLLFWEIEHAAERHIPLPEELDDVFEHIIGEFAKQKPSEKAISIVKGRYKALTAGFGFIKQMPLAKGISTRAAKSAKKVPTLASKAFDKLKDAGRAKVKQGLSQLLGGSR
ncbi:MAG: zf-HC2 domain-containing protein [Clostridia bacterium]|nr:zf-HC2 domain-containing protein [Clostridia bacterium]